MRTHDPASGPERDQRQAAPVRRREDAGPAAAMARGGALTPSGALPLQQAAGNRAVSAALQRQEETREREGAATVIERGAKNATDATGQLAGGLTAPHSGSGYLTGTDSQTAVIGAEAGASLNAVTALADVAKSGLDLSEARREREQAGNDETKKAVAGRKIGTAQADMAVGVGETAKNVLTMAEKGATLAGGALTNVGVASAAVGVVPGAISALRNSRKALKAWQRLQRLREEMSNENDPRGAYDAALKQTHALKTLIDEMTQGVDGKRQEVKDAQTAVQREEKAVADAERSVEGAQNDRREQKKKAKQGKSLYGTRGKHLADASRKDASSAQQRLRAQVAAKAAAETQLQQATAALGTLNQEFQAAEQQQQGYRQMFDELTDALKRYSVTVERDVAGKRSDEVTLEKLRQYADKKNQRGVVKKLATALGSTLSLAGGIATLVSVVAAAAGGALVLGTPVGWGLAAAAAVAGGVVASWKAWQFFSKRWSREQYQKDETGEVKERSFGSRLGNTLAFWRKSGPSKREGYAAALYKLAQDSGAESLGVAELFERESSGMSDSDNAELAEMREAIATLDRMRAAEARQLIKQLGLDWAKLSETDPETAKSEIARKLAS